MATSGNARVSHYAEPASEGVALDSQFSDTVDLTSTELRALYIGVSGDVKVDMMDSGTALTFKSVPIGVLPIRPKRIYVTGTTATNLIGLK